MSIFKRARARSAAAFAAAVLLASGFACADELKLPEMTVAAAMPAEPFGPFTSMVPAGELSQKWFGVAREIEDELLVLALCEENRGRCRSPAALRFLDIVDAARSRDGRARLGEINRAFNLAIRPASDLTLYGVVDLWRSPLALLSMGAGDCEDYAIAKFVALRTAGVPAADLRIVIMRDTIRNEDHAVAAARLDGQWLLLDNRRMTMIEDGQAAHATPLFVIDHVGVRQYRDVPPTQRDIPTGA